MADREFLERKIYRNQQVVNELKNSGAWKIISEDYSTEKRRIDDTWALVTEPAKLTELRVAKLAIAQIINLIDSYEHDLRVAQGQLSAMDNPSELAEANYGEQS